MQMSEICITIGRKRKLPFKIEQLLFLVLTLTSMFTVTMYCSLLPYHRQEQSKVLIANDDDTAILDNAYLGGEWTMGKTFPDFAKEKFAGDFTEAYYNGVRCKFIC